MTGTWAMQAKTRDAKLVLLRFYAGPSAPPPNYVRLLGFLDNKKETQKSFKSQLAADEWAAKMGVRQWSVVHQSRAFPEAAKLPISGLVMTSTPSSATASFSSKSSATGSSTCSMTSTTVTTSNFFPRKFWCGYTP